MEKITVKLPNGNDLEVFSTPEFLEVVRNHFSLKDTSDVDSDHIRMFIYASTKSAFDKAELEDNTN
jgi:hypothetical protein|tara:strand:+ start:5844 stop:6041 length:198 start_codon:yes stop_codon:yes gene_type:complete